MCSLEHKAAAFRRSSPCSTIVDRTTVARVLSLRIAAGKIALTLLGLACGASIGREGPTVQVGAAIMYTLGRLSRLPRIDLERALVLGRRCRGRRRSVQHAARRRGVCHRGTQPLVRSTHDRHRVDGGHHRRHHHARTHGQLYVFRPGFGSTRLRPRLGGGRVVRRRRRTVRRSVQRRPGPRRTRSARQHRPVAGEPSGSVRRVLRIGAGRNRGSVRRADIRHRLRSGARHDRGDHHAARLLRRAEIRRDGYLLHQRNSRRDYSRRRCRSAPASAPGLHT